MTRVIKVPRSIKMEELDIAVSVLSMKEGEMGDAMVKEVFPLLLMDEWIDHILGGLPDGRFTTFGSIAKALGTHRASRAVGERIASGKLNGPVDRVVYSDGTFPGTGLRDSGGGGEREHDRVDTDKLVEFEVPSPPFSILSGLQDRMAGLLREEHPKGIELIAGADISSAGGVHAAALAVMDLQGESRGELCVRGIPGLPYVSGFLFYREAPLLLPLIALAMNDGFIDHDTLIALDGNGILHPRRMGIACQIGAATGARTCGIAKKLLVGKVSGKERMVNGRMLTSILDNGEIIGSSLRTKKVSRPVYVSRGNRIDLGTVERTISALTRNRIPEPTRRAHMLANECRRSEAPSRDL
ncbi:MAG: endonuclease V [Thermoplasmatota archaeon]